MAEIKYVVENEMACTLEDALLRRTGFTTIGELTDEKIETVAKLMGSILSWDESRLKKEIEDFKTVLTKNYNK